MIPYQIHKYFVEKFIHECIENRETCPHWIDYQVYDSVPEEVKKIYIDQFDQPRFYMVRSPGKDDFKNRIICRANHKDDICKVTCDCTSHYEKTLSKLSYAV